MLLLELFETICEEMAFGGQQESLDQNFSGKSWTEEITRGS
jgi:hypothetical protein